MDETWKTAFETVRAEAAVIKNEGLNKHDPAFDPWHRRARSVLLKYAPVKIPAFDEIRFASDFFLSKPGEDQLNINDRVALGCDLDLAVEIFNQSQVLVEEELRFKKSRERFQAAQSLTHAPESSAVAAPAPASVPTADFESLNEWVGSLDLAQREKDEALEELRRAQQALTAQPPDWDRIKRTIKFLLDFDRTLALKAVPVLLQGYEQNHPA